MAVERQQDPASLVARIIAELKANPEAQRLLLRTLLTNEFLGMPARLDRIEKDIVELKADVRELKADVRELKTDVRELKTDVSQLKTDVSQMKNDIGQLKGTDLENRLHRRIRSLASQALKLRGAHVVQGPVQETDQDFADPVEQAWINGAITNPQYNRILDTDFIMRARRRGGAAVWVAVEASNKVDEGDIQRARATADILQTVLDADVLAMVAGYDIDPQDAQRAKAAQVRYLKVSQVRPS